MTTGQLPGAVVRIRVHVSGRVQGVGFRPFVWREATVRGLSGWVGNDAAGVIIEVEGAVHAVEAFLSGLRQTPPLARVNDIHRESITPLGDPGFVIHASSIDGVRQALVSPDTATCSNCLREMHDPADRRFLHPFVNCTSCGPRYSIMRAVPYDRARTTMAAFPLCPNCRLEYEDPSNRRFHAEPICCPNCGPQLRLLDSAGRELPGAAVATAAERLRAGDVVAVKGLGGYHLAVDARNEDAVAALRARKHREDRPFAVLVRDAAATEKLCEISPEEQALLTSAARPIVLLRRRDDSLLAWSVAPGSPSLGVMLPYSPLHSMLLDAYDGPLVLTSGNRTDEPIAFRDADAIDRLGDIADAYLMHNREIHTRLDDSVVAVVRRRAVPLRRSRGYAPDPIVLSQMSHGPVLACGSARKNTFCITRGQHAFVSQHIGDLDDYLTFQSYLEAIGLLSELLDVAPVVVAYDRHPDYPSTQYAQQLSGVRLIDVQHHHAHIASCMADNGVVDPVIGVAFDGVGLGDDGTSWGGEFLVADLVSATRAAHFTQVPMPGGDAATKQPWRMAASHLDAAYAGDIPSGLDVTRRAGKRWDHVLALTRSAELNAPLTSSAGRLFDAVSALLGVRDVVTYEGQAAIELEHVAEPAVHGGYPVTVTDASVAQVLVGDLVRSVVDDMAHGTAVPIIAGRFHNAMADMVLNVCRQLRDVHGLSTVALSGGVFQNALLLGGCMDRLEADGFSVLTHRRVPANDGGLSLGQAAVAVARMQSG